MEPVQLSPDEMAAMHKASFPTRPWKPKEFEELMEANGVFWGVDHEKRGFIMARKAGDLAEILTLVVDPEHRRQGVGRDLVSNIIATCPSIEATHLFLEVAADNRAASDLYEALGFMEVGRRPNYYVRGEAPPADAVVMGRAIAQNQLV